MFICELSNENMNAKGCVPKECLCVDRVSGLSNTSNISPLQSTLLSHLHN
jgi:hypothetical protein